MTEEPIIVCENVKKTFNVKGQTAPVHALRGITLKVERGTMIAIKGDSGSGKTTLLQMLGALDVPTSGTVIINGRNLLSMTENELTEYRAKTVGFVFQSFNLIPNLSAFENVELPLEAMKVPQEERRTKAVELLNEVGMEDRMEHKPSKLSGGEQQRVAIARALANDPSIILADEPTGNLDSKTGQSVIHLLNTLRKEKGKTVVLVTHSEKAAKVCDRTIRIQDGVLATKMNEGPDIQEADDRRNMRDVLGVSGKVLSKLFASDYTEFEDIADADPDDLAYAIGGNFELASSIIEKAKAARERESEESAGEEVNTRKS
jgi:putative ABC transport system ATP-binding protein